MPDAPPYPDRSQSQSPTMANTPGRDLSHPFYDREVISGRDASPKKASCCLLFWTLFPSPPCPLIPSFSSPLLSLRVVASFALPRDASLLRLSPSRRQHPIPMFCSTYRELLCQATTSLKCHMYSAYALRRHVIACTPIPCFPNSYAWLWLVSDDGVS